MTRVWPIAMVQLPTVIYMISEFMNSLRVVYMDGRPHSEPDVVVPSFNGESIGRWEGDTLVIDTKYFVGHHHWIDSGIPISDAMHIVERIRKINNGQTLEIEFAATDPKSWEGEWKWTKRWNRVDDRDIAEVSCLPDLNDHMPSHALEGKHSGGTLMTRSVVGWCCAMVLGMAALAAAHHSAAGVDRTKSVTVNGIVKEFRWTNPHSWIDLTCPMPKAARTLGRSR